MWCALVHIGYCGKHTGKCPHTQWYPFLLTSQLSAAFWQVSCLVPLSQSPSITSVPLSHSSSITSVPLSHSSSVTSAPLPHSSSVTSLPLSHSSSITYVPLPHSSSVTSLPLSHASSITSVPLSHSSSFLFHFHTPLLKLTVSLSDSSSITSCSLFTLHLRIQLHFPQPLIPHSFHIFITPVMLFQWPHSCTFHVSMTPHSCTFHDSMTFMHLPYFHTSLRLSPWHLIQAVSMTPHSGCLPDTSFRLSPWHLIQAVCMTPHSGCLHDTSFRLFVWHLIQAVSLIPHSGCLHGNSFRLFPWAIPAWRWSWMVVLTAVQPPLAWPWVTPALASRTVAVAAAGGISEHKNRNPKWGTQSLNLLFFFSSFFNSSTITTEVHQKSTRSEHNRACRLIWMWHVRHQVRRVWECHFFFFTRTTVFPFLHPPLRPPFLSQPLCLIHRQCHCIAHCLLFTVTARINTPGPSTGSMRSVSSSEVQNKTPGLLTTIWRTTTAAQSFQRCSDTMTHLTDTATHLTDTTTHLTDTDTYLTDAMTHLTDTTTHLIYNKIHLPLRPTWLPLTPICLTLWPFWLWHLPDWHTPMTDSDTLLADTDTHLTDTKTHLTEASHPHQLVDASIVEVVDKLRHLRHVLNGHWGLLWWFLYLHKEMISGLSHSFCNSFFHLRQVQ